MSRALSIPGIRNRLRSTYSFPPKKLAVAEPEPKLKLCVLAACPFPANHGTPGSIRELVEATAERGHEVHVVTYHIGEDLPVKRRDGSSHSRLDWRPRRDCRADAATGRCTTSR